MRKGGKERRKELRTEGRRDTHLKLRTEEKTELAKVNC
jgi:hypothetical protein